MQKIRVNISVDKELLEGAKKKLHLFGGKLSTLFNAYLKDFVDSMNKKSLFLERRKPSGKENYQASDGFNKHEEKIEVLEKRIDSLEKSLFSLKNKKIKKI